MKYFTKQLFLFIFLIASTQLTFSQVGIGTTSPSNELDVEGWIEIGDQSQTGNDIEGTIRYNSTFKCMQFYDGSIWSCIGKPKMQNFTLRDGISQNVSGNVSNITNFNGGGYAAQYSFVVNDLQQGDTVLFLLELVIDDNLRKNSLFSNLLKISGNGIFVEKEVPGVDSAETYSTFIWGNSLNNSGNLSFTFEINMDLADARITTLIFR